MRPKLHFAPRWSVLFGAAQQDFHQPRTTTRQVAHFFFTQLEKNMYFLLLLNTFVFCKRKAGYCAFLRVGSLKTVFFLLFMQTILVSLQEQMFVLSYILLPVNLLNLFRRFLTGNYMASHLTLLIINQKKEQNQKVQIAKVKLRLFTPVESKLQFHS